MAMALDQMDRGGVSGLPMILILAIVWICRPASSFSTLMTFDVDGTLVSSSPGWETGAHGRSFIRAVDLVLGAEGGSPAASGEEATVPSLLEKREFHGSTDGLILLRLARRMLGPAYDAEDASSRVDEMMDEMFRFVSARGDDEVARGIAPLPGVLGTLRTLASRRSSGGDGDSNADLACGLVTGNVEGIARRKMRALGILETGALTTLSAPQGGRTWEGVEDSRFLGGFGSDYCSGRIDDPERNHLDRGEQLAICVERCLALPGGDGLERVIHVGDAPADILAARSYVHHPARPSGVCVSVVGVATGSYSAEELQKLCGEKVAGVWEPVVLDQGTGVGDEEAFLSACGLI